MKDSRRKFTEKQKKELFVLTDGRESCSDKPLRPGWHADHVIPHSKGGMTELSNAAALPPEANLKKGNKHMTLRRWQEKAILLLNNRIADEGRLGNVLISAVPGGGKTRLGCEFFKRHLKSTFDRVIIVSPNNSTKGQWKKEFASMGIQVEEGEDKRPPKLRDGWDEHKEFAGYSITYSLMDYQSDMIDTLCRQERTLVILDEVHHLGENASWGSSAKRAFEFTENQLCLTGTPWRTKGTKIEFVPYKSDEDGWWKVDSLCNYTYEDALNEHASERPVVPSDFFTFDGRVKFYNLKSKSVDYISLEEELPNKSEAAKRLWSALDLKSIKTLLENAVRRLDERIGTNPIEKGIVVAKSIPHAKKVAGYLTKITKSQVTIVHSKEDGSRERINRFRQGKTKSNWIVAVDMVSEGVDIPQLSVLVYATNKTTRLRFRQITGRVIRSVAGKNRCDIFILGDPRMIELAKEMYYEMPARLREIDQELQKGEGKETSKQEGGEDQNGKIWMGADLQPGGVITRNGRFTQEEVDIADDCKRKIGGALDNVETTVLLEWMAGVHKENETKECESSESGEIKDLEKDQKDLREVINKRVNSLWFVDNEGSRARDAESKGRISNDELQAIRKKFIQNTYGELIREAGGRSGSKLKSLSTEQLKKALDIINQWIHNKQEKRSAKRSKKKRIERLINGPESKR